MENKKKNSNNTFFKYLAVKQCNFTNSFSFWNHSNSNKIQIMENKVTIIKSKRTKRVNK